jgi:hypothetical protein
MKKPATFSATIVAPNRIDVLRDGLTIASVFRRLTFENGERELLWRVGSLTVSGGRSRRGWTLPEDAVRSVLGAKASNAVRDRLVELERTGS